MITGSTVAKGEGFAIATVRCDGGCRGFDVPEQERSHVLVAVHRGVVVRRVEAEQVVLDGTLAYLSAPGIVEQFAHPVAGGDVCTAIHLSSSLMADLAGGDPFVSAASVPVDARSELALRQLTVLARRGDAGGVLAEHLVRAVASLLARRHPGRVASGRPGTARARRRLVDQARAAMHADPGIGLIELAAHLACSPHHLSRVFTQLTGSTISHYRNRLRVSLALDRIAQGEGNLTRIACELGFADHAHLTRTVRAFTGCPPTCCRRLLLDAGRPDKTGARQ